MPVVEAELELQEKQRIQDHPKPVDRPFLDGWSKTGRCADKVEQMFCFLSKHAAWFCSAAVAHASCDVSLSAADQPRHKGLAACLWFAFLHYAVEEGWSTLQWCGTVPCSASQSCHAAA